uniref:WD repeat domain phosphoinositide-interacting protein 2 n=2 Tax=Lygus hesperus TaxID=30085 RepID=A0A0A9WBM0_LYGHE
MYSISKYPLTGPEVVNPIPTRDGEGDSGKGASSAMNIPPYDVLYNHTLLCVPTEAPLGQPSNDAAVQVISLRTYESLGKFCVTSHSIRYMCVSTNGKMLAVASDKGTLIRIYRIPDGALLLTFRRGTRALPICSLAFSPDGKLLLTASSHSTTIHIFALDDAAFSLDALYNNRLQLPHSPTPTTVHHLQKLQPSVNTPSSSNGNNTFKYFMGFLSHSANAVGTSLTQHVQSLGATVQSYVEPPRARTCIHLQRTRPVSAIFTEARVVCIVTEHGSTLYYELLSDGSSTLCKTVPAISKTVRDMLVSSAATAAVHPAASTFISASTPNLSHPSNFTPSIPPLVLASTPDISHQPPSYDTNTFLID